MKWFSVPAAALSAALMLGAPASAADACKSSCDKSYQGCLKKSAAEMCLPTWSQCKRKCSPAKPMAAATPMTPAGGAAPLTGNPTGKAPVKR